MAIDIIKRTSTANTTYFPGRSIKYIVFHYTAGSSSRTGSARGVATMFSNPTVRGSADFIVDDTEIVQFSPDIDNYCCWHSGVDYSGGTAPYWGKCTNANSIGIEVCSTNPNYDKNDSANSPKWSFTDAAVETAFKLIKHLMQKYNIPASNVIRHWDVCRKPCPGVIGWNTYNGSNESKWLAFKQKLGSTTTTTTTTNTKTDKPVNTPIYRVRKAPMDSTTQIGAYAVLANAKKQADANPGYKVYDMTGKLVYEPKSAAGKKSIDDVAREVIRGKWGNGSTRKYRLIDAGYDYDAVQKRVNELMR